MNEHANIQQKHDVACTACSLSSTAQAQAATDHVNIQMSMFWPAQHAYPPVGLQSLPDLHQLARHPPLVPVLQHVRQLPLQITCNKATTSATACTASQHDTSSGG